MTTPSSSSSTLTNTYSMKTSLHGHHNGPSITLKTKSEAVYERYFAPSMSKSEKWRQILQKEDDLDEWLLLDIDEERLSHHVTKYISSYSAVSSTVYLPGRDASAVVNGNDNRISALVHRLLEYANERGNARRTRESAAPSMNMDTRRVHNAIMMISVALKTILQCCEGKLLQVMMWLTGKKVTGGSNNAVAGGGGVGGRFAVGDRFFKQLIERTRDIESRNAIVHLWFTMIHHNALVEYFTLVDVGDALECWQALNLLLILSKRCGGTYTQRLERSKCTSMWISVVDAILEDWLEKKWEKAVALHNNNHGVGSGAWQWIKGWFSGDSLDGNHVRDIPGVVWNNDLILIMLLWDAVGMSELWMDALVRSRAVYKWIEVFSALLLLDIESSELIVEWALRSWMNMMESKVFRRCVYNIRNPHKIAIWKQGIRRLEQSEGGGTIVRVVLEVIMDTSAHLHHRVTATSTSMAASATTAPRETKSTATSKRNNFNRLQARAVRCVHGIIAMSRRYRIRLSIGNNLWNHVWCNVILPVILDQDKSIGQLYIDGDDNAQVLCACLMLANLILLHGDEVLPERAMWEEMIEAIALHRHRRTHHVEDSGQTGAQTHTDRNAHKMTGTMAKLMRNIRVVCDDAQLAIDLTVPDEGSLLSCGYESRSSGMRRRLMERWKDKLDDASHVIEWPVKWPLPEREEREERRWNAEMKRVVRDCLSPILIQQVDTTVPPPQQQKEQEQQKQRRLKPRQPPIKR